MIPPKAIERVCCWFGTASGLARRERERFLVCSEGAHVPRVCRVVILMVAVLSWAPSWALYSVRDDLQRSVSFDKPPQRVISLLPSLTESVCALNECQRLVATDRYSNWPASVSALPKAGGLEDTQVELIVSLRPDVVLLDRSARVTERLAQLGIKTFVIETTAYADIARSLSLVAHVLGVPQRAAEVSEALRQEVDTIAREAQTRRGQGQPLSVYFEVDDSIFAAGEASFIGELLTRLGARNIVPAALGPFPKLNPEYVVRHNPDVIFIAQQQVRSLGGRPGWAGLRAVREQRICPLAAQTLDVVVRPGPRVADGMRALAGCLGPVNTKDAGIFSVNRP